MCLVSKLMSSEWKMRFVNNTGNVNCNFLLRKKVRPNRQLTEYLACD